MIDKLNGSVTIGSVTIDSEFEIGGFRTTEFENQLVGTQSGNGEWATLYLSSPILLNGMLASITFNFKNQKISAIEIANADPELMNSYSNWSLERLERKKQSHDEWLVKEMGSEPPYVYPWGAVESYLDPRSGNVAIVLTYQP